MPRFSTSLIAAWAWLAGLSVLAALVAHAAAGQGTIRAAAGVAILTLAIVKARVILARYLDLAQAPGWLRGFVWVIVLWALSVLGLYLVPVLTA